MRGLTATIVPSSFQPPSKSEAISLRLSAGPAAGRAADRSDRSGRREAPPPFACAAARRTAAGALRWQADVDVARRRLFERRLVERGPREGVLMLAGEGAGRVFVGGPG
ncbi:MAG: hypothetical protein JSU06_02225 [Actinobacteria bacterium]|nr:hypothetical protein [Actinomycetota bacterium]